MIRLLVWLVPISLALYFGVLAMLPWEAKRKLRHGATYFVGALGAAIAMIPLVMLVYYLVHAGAPGLSLHFFTQVQKPFGEPGGGMLHAIVGSLIIIGISSLIGIPLGVLTGIYLAEYGHGKFAAAVRFLAEVLTGLPSIIAGILAFALIVVPAKGFSALAGSIALSVLMIPVVTRVTEESLKLVPSALREASFALGVGSWQTILKVVLPAARSGILTGVVLAIARVGGETAPLLFTANGQNFLVLNPLKAMAALPLSIYINSGQPDDVSRQLATTGALFLVAWIALVNVGVRWIASRRQLARS